ncbi:MAG TPA: PEP-CTERM sorting domain-containing protein [Burkholderiaceae bacterium]|nr:PEP-CTERM sorting domain-containing protein [Burkholderiaceae bacterium]
MVAALGCAGSASAAVYAGSWDPDFGGSFSGLGWKGEATFYIPDSCLALSGLVSNGNACSGGGMQVLDAEVTFYDYANPATVYETLTFTSLANTVLGMYVDATTHQVSGINTNFIGPVQSLAGPAQGNYFDLVFQQAKVALYYTPDTTYNPGTCASGPLALEGCGVSVNIPTMTITPVPEPSSYALLLAGLGAMGLVARRRRRG